MHVGVPCAPISPAYSLLLKDYAKLRYVFGLATPGLVFAQDEVRFAAAVAAAVPKGTEVLFGERFAELESRAATARVDEAHARVGPDTIAKFLFTSGSTGRRRR